MKNREYAGITLESLIVIPFRNEREYLKIQRIGQSASIVLSSFNDEYEKAPETTNRYL